tara:strand:+ start:6547 stop:7731 length:1185 start_codon:yes stop_codon:yes gene_type:complete
VSWPVVKLGDVVKFIGGSQPPKSTFKYEPMEGYIRLLQIRDYKSNNNLTFIPESSTKKFCSKKDIMIGRYGPPVFQILRGLEGAYNVALMKAEPSKSVDRDYLFYFLRQDTLFRLIDGLSQRTAGQSGIDMDALKSYPMLLPPLDEQKRIAAILDKADAIRRKRQQAIQLADDFLRSVFLDMFGDPISNPKEWEVKKLKEISSKISSGNTPKGGSKNYVDEGITFMRSQNVWKNKLLLDDVVYIDEKTHESMSKSSLKRKDILMTKTGRINTENSSLGRAALYLGEDGKANLNGHVYFIRLVENILHEFVVFILTTIEYRDYIRSVCVGGIDKRQLNKNHLEEFPIIYPPKKMQEQFVKKVNVASNMLEKAKSGLKESEQMFNGLSQKAFSGEL